jgi:hypothetical protein
MKAEINNKDRFVITFTVVYGDEPRAVTYGLHLSSDQMERACAEGVDLQTLYDWSLWPEGLPDWLEGCETVSG